MDRDEFQLKPKRRRRGMYILPSVFTSINIGFGYYAITQSLQGSLADHSHFNRAALAIGLAIPFDALDGRIARMTNTTSDFGKELDSLADVITFGVAPSILAWSWGFRTLQLLPNSTAYQQIIALGTFISFLFLICGASRLARFNISVNPAPSNPGRPDRKYFVGCPIPAAAGCIAAVVQFFNGSPIYEWWWARGLDGLCRRARLADGQPLALLERQGDQSLRTPSLPGDGTDRFYRGACSCSTTSGADRHCAGLSLLGPVGAAGLQTAAAGCSRRVDSSARSFKHSAVSGKYERRDFS